MTDPKTLFAFTDRMCQYAVSDVLVERGLQDDKWGVPDHQLVVWLAILGEEFGELCQAVLEGETFDNGRRAEFDRAQIRQEIVQVCAVALAMIECFDRAKAVPR